MLKRKIYDALLQWKEYKNKNEIKEALLIKGARQVGKSYIIEKFGSNKNIYESFIGINFIERPDLKAAFKECRDPNKIYSNLSILLPNMKLIPGKTLFFLDEIQNCGDARTAIKFLAQDLRFDFIASGSLLGLEYGEDGDANVEVPESIPVGYESTIMMHPMDFEEFLWARGYDEKHINELREYYEQKQKVPDIINEKMEQLFREFIVVGGMPEVVSAFIKNNDFNDAIRVQNKILNDYKEDISKHAKGEQKIKVKSCFDSIPKQLSRELKRFQYAFVEKGQTSRKYGGSIKWLKDSSIANICYNISKPELPLVAYEKEEQFKIYLNDIGLLTQLYGRETKIAILNNAIKGNGKGAIYENVIAQMLVSKGYLLHYYKPDDDHELEFLIEKNGGIVPIEVKAGNSSSTSLNNFIKDFSPLIGIKLINGNLGFVDRKYSIPHYMVMFI
jgi:hypothetical protein